MCLILLALNAHPDYPLVLAANRDEFHARPTEALHWWTAPAILAGRDVQAGGTWMGLTRAGRFAALTNVREGLRPKTGVRSRGLLVTDALGDSRAPEAFIAGLDGQAYDGYNLLLGQLWPRPILHWASNRGEAPRRLADGLHGLSNAGLDPIWPKVRSGIAALAAAVADGAQPERLFALLADTTQAPDAELPQTGVPYEWEKRLSARFIVSPDYGTRSSSVLRLRRDGWLELEERRFEAGGVESARAAWSLNPDPS